MPTRKRATPPSPHASTAEPTQMVAASDVSVPAPTPVETPPEPTTAPADDSLESVALAELRPSPFLPAGRLPDMEGLAAVIERIGDIRAICTAAGAGAFEELAENERELLVLGLSVRLHGVLEPPSVRRTEDGLEIVTGHRRVAAAVLAGLTTVAVRRCDSLDDQTAAAVVVQSNQAHVALTPWQRLRLVLAVRAMLAQRPSQEPGARRGRGRPEREDGPSRVASLLAMPYSTAKAYVSMSEALTDEVLAKVGPDLPAVHAVLACLPLTQLRALAVIESEEERIAAIRNSVGPKERAAGRTPQGPSSTRLLVNRTDRGYTLHVPLRLDALDDADARQLLRVLQEEAKRLTAHLQEKMVAPVDARLEGKERLRVA